jgi:hypothetical protein
MADYIFFSHYQLSLATECGGGGGGRGILWNSVVVTPLIPRRTLMCY